MLQPWCRHRSDRRREAGFALVELLVVLAVIAVLVAIAVPTFLGAKGRATDAAAQSTLNTAAKSATLVRSGASFDVITRPALQAMEPNVTWNVEDAPSNGPTEVAWSTNPDPSPTNLVLVVKSTSGRAYYRVESTVALTATSGGTTSLSFTGSFETVGGVEASPTNALQAAKGQALIATTSTTAAGPTTTTAAVPTTTTVKPTTTTTVKPTTTTTVKPTTTTTVKPTTTTTVKPTTTTTVKPTTTTTIPTCKAPKVYDPVTKKCK